MSALPRPDLPPGPHRELVDALHELHHRAGWPSLRALAKEAGCSHTTVSKVFSSSQLPAWGTVELLVEAMGGDVPQFHRLWLAVARGAAERAEGAGARGSLRRALGGAAPPRVRHRAAGGDRRGRHGQEPSGESRCWRRWTCLVAFGTCLPLSHSVPLMPVADALASASAADHGRRVDELVVRGPAYLRPALARLLPELDPGPGPGPDARPAAAVPRRGSTARDPAAPGPRRPALGGPGHAGPPGAPVVSRAPVSPGGHLATGRLDPVGRDPRLVATDAPPAGHVTMELRALDRRETAEQIERLGVPPDPGLVDRVYARSGGQPLFTEQLAVHGGEELPELLADLLDRRLGALGPDAEVVAVRLGVADRPLPVGLLGELTLRGERLDAALHELKDRYLLASSAAGVALGHPLLAEAARQRLLPHERRASAPPSG